VVRQRQRVVSRAGEVAKWLRQRFAKPSGPKGSRGFESHPLRQRRVRRGPAVRLDGCPSGSRSTIGNRVGLIALVGSNPTPSAGFWRPPGTGSRRSQIARARVPQAPAPAQAPALFRGVAQPGRALRSGRRGRWFKSSLPDWWALTAECPSREVRQGGVALTGKAPHSKCGGRKPMGVRVPPPP
jgi:hypothetical protein